MSHDDRIRRAFDDVAAQAGAIEPPQMGEIAEQVAVTRIATRRGWLPAVAAAAVIVVAVGAVVLLDGGGDEGVPPGSQTDSTVNTSIPGVTAATSATVGVQADSTTDTTLASEASAQTGVAPDSSTTIAVPVDSGTGWRVVGVASDDVLNVRSGSGVEYPIVGMLAHDDVDVVLSGWGATQLDGSGWWGVQLVDGTEGFVNKRFLAPPASWLDGVDRLSCDTRPAVDYDPVALSTDPVSGSDATGVLGLAHIEFGLCDRYVIVLGSGPPFGQDVEAGIVPGGIVVYSVSGEVVVDFGGVPDGPSSSVLNVQPTASNAKFGSALVITSVAGGSDISLIPRVHIFTSEGRASLRGVTFREHPARVVVDVVGADQRIELYLLPEDGPTVLVGFPIVNDRGPIEVRGFARWFEAQGIAKLFNADGDPFPATWSGWSVFETHFGEDVGVSAPWSPTWGEFLFDIEEVPPGDYALFVGESCLVDEANDEWEDCGVTTMFTVP